MLRVVPVSVLARKEQTLLMSKPLELKKNAVLSKPTGSCSITRHCHVVLTRSLPCTCVHYRSTSYYILLLHQTGWSQQLWGFACKKIWKWCPPVTSKYAQRNSRYASLKCFYSCSLLQCLCITGMWNLGISVMMDQASEMTLGASHAA